MFSITMHKTFMVGDTVTCTIDGKEVRLTYRDKDTLLLIEPRDALTIVQIRQSGDNTEYICSGEDTNFHDIDDELGGKLSEAIWEAAWFAVENDPSKNDKFVALLTRAAKTAFALQLHNANLRASQPE
jgi:hypothetical protein